MKKFAATVYAAPDEWGNEPTYFDDTVADELIEQLKALGDDWQKIDLRDADRYDFLQNVNGFAIYEQRWVRRANYMILSDSDGGYYTAAGFEYSIDDAIDFCNES